MQKLGRQIASALVVALCGVCLLGLWVGIRGALAIGHLQSISENVSGGSLQQDFDEGQFASKLRVMASEAAVAHELTSDILWRTSEGIPWIGPQLTALAVVAAASDEVFAGSISLGSELDASFVERLKPVDGRLDPAVLGELGGPARQAADAASKANTMVSGVEQRPLLGVVRTQLEKAQGVLGITAQTLESLSRAIDIAPELLGENGPRRYLLLIQNNAEFRSLGGITGTIGLLSADDGRITLDSTESATALTRDLKSPTVNLPEEIQAVYGTKPARFFHNLTAIPDFRIDGPLARDMYRTQRGVDVDGVIAIDPVALSYVLQATGPISLPGGDVINSDNVVPLLLNVVYTRYKDPIDQDKFFAAASERIFQALLTGQGSTLRLLASIATASEQRRVLVWSAHPDLQSALEGSPITGEIPTSDDTAVRMGVYFNDATGSKMSYYLKPEISIIWNKCEEEPRRGLRQLAVEVTLSSTAPLDGATSLPPYITGNGVYGVAPGWARTVSNVYLPVGWELVSAGSTNGSNPKRDVVGGQEVLTFESTLAPQSTASFTLVIQSTTAANRAEVWMTPTADARISPLATASCGNDAPGLR